VAGPDVSSAIAVSPWQPRSSAVAKVRSTSAWRSCWYPTQVSRATSAAKARRVRRVWRPAERFVSAVIAWVSATRSS
jgi:hypothetical protein